jgi:hypothetical protein
MEPTVKLQTWPRSGKGARAPRADRDREQATECQAWRRSGEEVRAPHADEDRGEEDEWQGLTGPVGIGTVQLGGCPTQRSISQSYE